MAKLTPAAGMFGIQDFRGGFELFRHTVPAFASAPASLSGSLYLGGLISGPLIAAS